MGAAAQMLESVRVLEVDDWNEAVDWARSWTDDDIDALVRSSESEAFDLYMRIQGLRRNEKSLV